MGCPEGIAVVLFLALGELREWGELSVGGGFSAI